MDIHSEINSISLCSGVGMLDEGLKAGLGFFGIKLKTLCFCELNSFAQATLVARMEEKALEEALVWDDLKKFPCEFFGKTMVDGIVSAGIPCQGNSLAGERRMEEDERNLWPDTRKIIRDLGAGWFFLENVQGFIVPDRKGGRAAPITRVLGELSEDGFDAEWKMFPASDIGASHKRERIFLLARRKDMANTFGKGLQSWREESHAGRRTIKKRSASICSSDIFAPAQNSDKWREIIAKNPEMYPIREIESPVSGMANGLSKELDESNAANDRIRCCGNGVVALQAATAFVEMFQRLMTID